MIPGKEVTLNGVVYTVAPLAFRQLRELQPKIEGLGDIRTGMSIEKLDDVIDIVHAALSRNHPEITRDAVLDMVDMGNMPAIMAAVTGVSGLVQGEATAGSP